MLKQTLALVGVTLSISAQAATVSINFDDLSAGTVVDNFYLSQGVGFIDAVATSHSFVDGSAGIWHITTAQQPQQADPIVAFFTSDVSFVSLEGRDVNGAGYILSAYDSVSGGNLLATDQVFGPTSTTGNDNYILSFNVEGIRRIEFSQENLNGGDGLAFDNLTFTATVPVPAAAWLFGSALIGLVGFKRKK
jgi:hypothetical protein